MKQVDVIIPCYNYGRFLTDCVASVLSQDEVDVRVLIIDDASSDGSQGVASRIATSDHRISLVLHQVNRGHIATYNEGLDWADAEFMLLLSADDLLTPGALHRAVAAMDAFPEVSMTYGNVVHVANGEPMPLPSADNNGCGRPRLLTGCEFIDLVVANLINPVETATAVVRTATQKSIGHYDPRLPHAGDLHMWLRFASVNNVAFLPSVQAIVRLHQANMRLRYYADGMIEDYNERLRALSSFFADAGAGIPDRSGKHQTFRASLSRRMLTDAIRAVDKGGRYTAIQLGWMTIRAEYTNLLSLSFLELSAKLILGTRAVDLLISPQNSLRACIARLLSRPTAYEASHHPRQSSHTSATSPKS